MNNFGKKLLFSVLSFFLGTTLAFSQNTVKHIIDRGETLQSIAKRYSTTPEKIIELNPDAAQFIYVGMELQIPATETTQSASNTNTQSLNSTVISHNDNANEEPNSNSSDFDRWAFALDFGYGFIPKPDVPNTSGSSYTYSATAGANYYFTKYFFVGARVGYCNSQNSTTIRMDVGDYQRITVNSHFIKLPIETGFKLPIWPNKISLSPYVGVDMHFLVKATCETGLGSNTEKEDIENGDTFQANGKAGIRLSLWGFNLGCAYVYPFQKKGFGDNSGFPEVSLGFGF